MSNRLDQEKENQLQPKRMAYAKERLQELGITPFFECDTRIDFLFKGEIVMFYPYSGWHTGKSINDGRGIENLLKQLKQS